MNPVVVIPARMASTRLPGKPLADIAGKPMIVQVALRAAESGFGRVVVATDTEAVAEAVRRHGFEAVMTRIDHASGSDRIFEALQALDPSGNVETVVNVQGDEPLIDPALIDACAAQLNSRTDCVMSTAAHPLDEAGQFANPNVVKVVLDAAGRALYFSRAPIPWWRDAPTAATPAPGAGAPLRHIGIYGYRAGFLRRYPTLPASPLEAVESLEQLRVLWHGERIAVHVTPHAPGAGVDTPEDLERVRALLRDTVA